MMSIGMLLSFRMCRVMFLMCLKVLVEVLLCLIMIRLVF